jgi:predicted transposase YbfD/YdcC
LIAVAGVSLKEKMKSPIDYFTEIEDPRVERTKAHLLSEIIFITIVAVICGAETWNEIELYAKTKESWLRKYLLLANGIPSHDTFNRVFNAIDPQKFEDCFVKWVKDVSAITEGEVVSIDGKSIRGSGNKSQNTMIHMVSAWSQQNHMVLGQVKTSEKSNEITAIPKLIDILELKGCIVTIDAMGCQTEIAKKIVEAGADYVLAVKGNQSTLEQDIEYTVKSSKPFDTYKHVDADHGRVETRLCNVYSDLSNIENLEKWQGLKTIVEIQSIRYMKATGKQQQETRLYITSLEPKAQKLAEAIRAHWGIENSLHWVLDVAFNEDKGTKTNPNSAQNFSLINKIALNLVKNEQTKKVGIKSKRLNAGWDNDYLIKILKN